MENLNALLTNPRYRGLLSIVKGIRNGLVYGAKIRLPHSLVMTFLFHEGSLQDKIKFILCATLQHARNLGLICLIYKSGGLLLEKACGGKHILTTFIPAAVAGYVVFGRNDKLNLQILLYLLSRIMMGLLNLALKKGLINLPKYDLFPLFAAVLWGVVLCLFEYEQDTLQPSLQNSMTYIFHDSSMWHSVWDFIIYNSQALW